MKPDCPDRWSMPGSGCVSHTFDTQAEADAYTTQQKALARKRDDDLVTMLFPENKWESGKKEGTPTGRWEARMWYGPFEVWIDTADYIGVGDADAKHGSHYCVHLSWPVDKCIDVPINQATRLDRFIKRLQRSEQEVPRAAINRSCIRKEPPPPPPPPPRWQRTKPWSTL